MRIKNMDLRFGLDYWQIRADGFQNPLYGPQGGYTFTSGATSLPGTTLGPYGAYVNALASFLLGTPSVAGVSITPTCRAIFPGSMEPMFQTT